MDWYFIRISRYHNNSNPKCIKNICYFYEKFGTRASLLRKSTIFLRVIHSKCRFLLKSFYRKPCSLFLGITIININAYSNSSICDFKSQCDYFVCHTFTISDLVCVLMINKCQQDRGRDWCRRVLPVSVTQEMTALQERDAPGEVMKISLHHHLLNPMSVQYSILCMNSTCLVLFPVSHMGYSISFVYFDFRPYEMYLYSLGVALSVTIL